MRPGLPARFAPLHTETGPKGNLPAATTSFIGHGEELTRLAVELPRRRLITLTGVGGVGKTRLAQEAARLAADEFPDGVWLCELAAVGAAEGVLAAVATSMSVRPQPGLSLLDSVVDSLRARRLLLILDNCEHVLEAAAALAERLASVCRTVTVLTTSREPLAVAPERVWPVRGLSPRVEGVELFCERALAADADFLPTDRDLLAEICQRLDGLPLALELAAARVRTLSLADLAEGLDDHFRLLHRRRGGEARHQTLRTTVEWSYQLLTDAERVLFDRLAVFAGSFDLAAQPRAVCAKTPVDPGDVGDMLARLVDKSMLTADREAAPTRYRLLETLRQYGVQQLGEHHELTDRRDEHLAYFVRLAERAHANYARGVDGVAGAVFFTEWDNLRGAFQWALQQGDHTAARRLLCALYCFSWYNLRHELGEWAEQLLGVGQPDAFTAGVAACFRSKQGEMNQALSIAEAGLAATKSPRGDGPALCWFTLAEVHWASARPEEAWTCAQRACAAVDETGDPAVVANAISEAAFIGCTQGLPGVEAFMARLERLTRTYHDPVAEYCLHLALAMRAMNARNRHEAEQHFQIALTIADELGVLQRSVARAAFANWALTTRMPGHVAVVRDAIIYLNQVRDNGAWTVIELQAIRWAAEGRLQAAAVILGHLERHSIGHAALMAQRHTAVDIVATAPDGGAWLRWGAKLDRDQLFDFALVELGRSSSDRPPRAIPADPVGQEGP